MENAEHPTVVVTGASSGVGLYASKALADRGWHVIMACRDLEKARRAVETHSINPERITLQHIDLGSQQSVRNFVKALGIVVVSVSECMADRFSARHIPGVRTPGIMAGKASLDLSPLQPAFSRALSLDCLCGQRSR